MFFFQTISSLLTRTFCALGLSKLPSTCLEKPYEGKYHIWWKNILSLNLGFLARTYQQDSKCISTVQRKFWGKKVCLKENPTKTFLAFSANTFLLNEEEKFENRSRNLSQKFPPFGEKFLARFSKRHLTCTEERFELKSFFWHFFFNLSRFLGGKLPVVGFSKPKSTSPEGDFVEQFSWKTNFSTIFPEKRFELSHFRQKNPERLAKKGLHVPGETIWGTLRFLKLF